MKKILFLLSIMTSTPSFADYAWMTAYAEPAYGKVNEDIKVNSKHSVNICNDTGIAKQYKITYKINCYNMTSIIETNVNVPNDKCVYYSHDYNTGQVKIPVVGNYDIKAITMVEGVNDHPIENLATLQVVY
jgi:hypothetical protein